MKRLTILGSTGSIGTQTLDVVRQNRDKFEVVAISANRSVDLILEQILEFKPKYAVLYERESAEKLKTMIPKDIEIEILDSIDGLVKISTIDEVDIAHYNKTIAYDEDTKSYQITNKHKVEKITIPVEKVWNDNNNNDGKRTKQVIVHLYAEGKDTGKTLTLSDTNHWKDSFVNLNQYSNGNKINYTVKEEKVNGYEIGYTGSQDKGYIITNTHDVETVEVKGTKTWNDNHDQDGKRPENITVRLYADGVEIASKVVDKDSNWTYDFGKLSKYKKGKEINYTVGEDEVAGYATEINDFDITNTHKILKTSVNVTKEWNDQDNQDGKRAKQVIVHLYADGKDTGKTLTLSDDNQWISSFDDLNQYKDGKEIVYTVQEDEVKGYKVFSS